jgi:adenosylcobinamide-GDP ribazoletransferase
MRRAAAELCGAFLLLTRLKMPIWASHGPACVWAYPLVGAAVGGIGAAMFRLTAMLPPMIGAVWALAAMTLLTGALHEDGLADTADGFGGGRTRAAKLAIMRDSRIGTFGTLALLFSVLLRASAIAQIATPSRVTAALIGSAALARGCMILLLLLLPPARAEGLSASVATPPSLRAAGGLLLAILIAALALPHLLLCLTATVASAAAIAWLAHRQIGGHTGDVLGAGEQICECVILTLLSIV